MRENGPGPTGWLVKSALAALPRLEIAPLFPAHGALLSPISRANTTTNNFETASSNAALHRMKHPDAVLAGVSRALVTDGRFVGEFGGAGNVVRIVTAIEAILIARGIDPETVNPWYFPGPDEYTQRLQAHGFEIISIEHFPRPTPLQVDISAWLEIFTLSFFNAFDNDERTTLLAEPREDLRGDLCDASGNWEVDYVRLRFSAIKRTHL